MKTRAAIGALTVLCCFITSIIFFFIVPSEIALEQRGYDYGAPFFEGRKAKKYTGWSLADDEFTDDVDPRKARILFYIMMSGHQDLAGLDVLLRNLYHVDHFFLIHLDVKAAASVRSGLKIRVERVVKERGKGLPNVRLVDPVTPITWGGFTMTLNAVYGLTQALHWNSKWDYFINLSASDLPLLRADEMAGILGEHKAANVSFIKGFKYEPSWEGYKFVDRREMFAEDVALMRAEEQEKRWPWAILDADKEMLTRPVPELFTVYKGEFWVTLHRSMADYVHKSPDNQARSLLGYFSGMMVSDEEYFQTLACNPHFPRDRLQTHNDNLRFVNWWGDQASPAVVPPFRAVAAANSGAIFGRKFSAVTSDGRDGIRWVEEYLADSSRSGARVDRVRRRLAANMTPQKNHIDFCGLTWEKNPAEAYYAVDGDEEKLTPEFQHQPPRRGAGGGNDEKSFASVDIRRMGIESERGAQMKRPATDSHAQGYISFGRSLPLSDLDGSGIQAERDLGGEDASGVTRDSRRGHRRMQSGATEDGLQSRSSVGETEAFAGGRPFELTPDVALRRERAESGDDTLRDTRSRRAARGKGKTLSRSRRRNRSETEIGKNET